MTEAKNKGRRTLAILCLSGVVVAQSGCLVAAAGACAGAGAYAYYRGTVSDTYGAEFGQVYQASKEALGDMAMPVVSENHEGLAGTIESSLADGTRVTVVLEEKPRMKSEDNHSTEVSIRIGTFGDQTASTQLQQQIARRVTEHLRGGPAPALPTGRSVERLPPLTQAQAVQPAVVPGGNQNPTNWKPAAQSNGEAPKPP
jgi:hypothetical protein